MPTSAFGNRYPQSGDAPNIPQYIQNAVTDVEGETVPRFATTAARDAAYAARVSAGYPMENGMLCFAGGKPYMYDTTATAGWRPIARGQSGGIASFTTSAGGDVLISHGLVVAPTTAWANLAGASSLATQFGKAVVGSVTATLLSIRVHDTRDGGTLNNFNVTLSWGATLL